MRLPKRDRVRAATWLIFVAAAAVVTAVYFLLPQFAQAVLYDGFELLTVAAVLVGIRINRPARVLPWLLVAGAQLCFVVGDVTWDVLALGFGEKPFPSFADVAYLSAYPVAAAAIFLLVRRRLPSPPWQWLVDIAVVTSGITMLLWIVTIEPILQSGDTDGTALAVSLAYPFADIVLLAALASLLITPRAASRADRLLGGSLLLLLAADMSFAAFPDLQSSGGPLDALYLAHSALWAAAALHPSMATAADHGTSGSVFNVRRIAALGLATMVPSVTLAVQIGVGSTNLAPAAIGCIGISLLVLIDAGMLMIDRERALRRRIELEEELFASRRLESLGRLAGGIAHDFNNVLTAIIGFADLAFMAAPRADTESIVTIREAAQRAATMTRQLLAFSGRQVFQSRTVELQSALTETEPILRQLLGEQIKLVVEVPNEPVAIRIDRGQLDQVLLNLSINARDAMPDGGRLTIVVATTDGRSRAAITVSDTGCGMDPKILPNIFEPFFTTKPTGKGTGLGLAMVHGIVVQSGGSISVKSRLGAGTTFEMSFPIAAPTTSERTPGSERSRRPKSAITIGIVEDETMVLELCARVLRGDGYNVVPMSDPIAALERMCRGTSIDVLLTDNIMPAMSGVELARRLRAIRAPNHPVVLMSGYSEAVSDWTGDGNVFLPKPFTASALLAAVDTALNPPAVGEQDAARVA